MEAESEKVYVAVGGDPDDGFATLDWALKRWPPPRSISVVILYATNRCTSFRDFVYTPFGKLPATVVSEEILAGNRDYEQEKTQELISQYMAFCGQVKTELLKVELTGGEPMHKFIIDLITKLRITKLVMSLTFVKASSWKSKNAISGSYYIHRHRPRFCDLHIICGGRLLFLGEENEEGIMQVDQGTLAVNTREGNKCKGKVGGVLAECSTNWLAHERSHRSSCVLPTSSDSTWEAHAQDIDRYYKELCANWMSMEGKENAESNMQGNEEKQEDRRMNVDETVQLKSEEVKAFRERRSKAEWAIALCNQRTKELEACINEEMTIRIGLEKELESTKEAIYEVLGDVRERKNRLSSILEIQSQLSEKLRLSSLGKSRTESQLEKTASARADILREIEELRQQRDILHRRVEFCRDKDALGKVAKWNNLGCSYREFTAEEIRLATDNFSECLRMKSGGDSTCVYQGRVNCTAVAIKLLDSVNGLSQEAFQAKVRLLGVLRHPNLVALIGFCAKPRCVVFEYMQNGSLSDVMNTSQSGDNALRWRDCIRIAGDVCAGLAFLHLAEPRPIVLGDLSPASILLGRNLAAAKVHCSGAARCFDKGLMRADVRAFGLLVLQLLAGAADLAWPGPVKEAMEMDARALSAVLDAAAGEWPMGLARAFAQIGLRCLSVGQSPGEDLKISTVMEEMNEMRRKAAAITAAREKCEGAREEGEESRSIPKVFLCPINQDVMRNPHVAADGFSYELEAIEEWIRGQGRVTSPMTNLKLKHSNLTPNHTLRSLIQDWQSKRFTTPPPPC